MTNPTRDPIAALLAWIVGKAPHGSFCQCRYCGVHYWPERSDEKHGPSCFVPDLRRALAARTEAKDWRVDPKIRVALQKAERASAALAQSIRLAYAGTAMKGEVLHYEKIFNDTLDALCDAVAASSTGAPRTMKSNVTQPSGGHMEDSGQDGASLGQTMPTRQWTFAEKVNDHRRAIKDIAAHVKATFTETKDYRGETDGVEDRGEMIANLMLCYRHLEDASGRLGKALQAKDGGVSVYDRKTTVGA